MKRTDKNLPKPNTKYSCIETSFEESSEYIPTNEIDL